MFEVAVDNVSGASGAIGVQRVARAQPDGHMLLITNNTIVTNAVTTKVPYDPLKDFEPIGMIGFGPIALAVNSSLVNNTQELIAYVKKECGKAFYSSSGNGTVWHLAGELFKQVAKLEMTHAPYKDALRRSPMARRDRCRSLSTPMRR